jgi:hypothetical protein
MPAMVEAKTPAATTSRIIPPIMNELLIFALHFARFARADSVARMGKGGYCAADTAAEKKRAHETPL